MIIFQKSKAVFFHNPRTGGNALYKELGLDQAVCPLQHCMPNTAREWIFQDTWYDYWKFSFVRNPWERMVSLYEHQYSNEFAKRPKSNSGPAPRYQFDEWVYLSMNKFLKTDGFVPQSYWMDVDHVYLYEERAKSLSEISKRIGVELKGIRTNDSKRQKHYTEYYRKKSTIETVGTFDHVPIKLFCYKFGD
jgi:hypothetical protein